MRSFIYIYSCFEQPNYDEHTKSLFYIYVLDHEKPEFIIPPGFVKHESDRYINTIPVDTGKDTAHVTTLTVDVTDNCGIANHTCEPRAPQTFGIGDTEVTCTAYDVNGNMLAFTYTIIVVGKPDCQIFVSNCGNCMQIFIAMRGIIKI